jgi:hypothetical protein
MNLPNLDALRDTKASTSRRSSQIRSSRVSTNLHRRLLFKISITHHLLRSDAPGTV